MVVGYSRSSLTGGPSVISFQGSQIGPTACTIGKHGPVVATGRLVVHVDRSSVKAGTCHGWAVSVVDLVSLGGVGPELGPIVATLNLEPG